MTEQFVTAVQVAELLQLSTDTVYRKAKTGELPVLRIGRRLRFLPSQIEAKAEQQKDEWAYLPRSRQGRSAA